MDIATAAASTPLPVEWFASGYNQRVTDGTCTELELTSESTNAGPWEDKAAKEGSNAFLTPQEEAVLITFYVTRLPSLMGPSAQVPRLRRESKVTATAALLMRRFYLSNSVMLHDPKAVMVAASRPFSVPRWKMLPRTYGIWKKARSGSHGGTRDTVRDYSHGDCVTCGYTL
jgi:hypothetical protein